ncbi:alpha/beta fold hydrolase [Paenibacillus aurantius]|uniref:Alpha/beta fold hydrolase n=1 Tax=Paenibacillus aurantius TaxID=2918900 RepID=A0AA96L8C7_9BACL|nr:alpha/beta fold hydrolase [Paenibacillus aurantius]WNQ08901.1 alpha/beta fold hydrolase [Paenibacillus aurantius]
MAMKTINGIQLYVEGKGEGEPILLIHGNGGNASQMSHAIEWLSRAYQTIAYDCRGHGRSEKPASYTLEDHIQDGLGLLNELGIERAHVIGVSGGGYIAQGLALAEPSRIGKLILVVTKAHGLKSSLQEFSERHADELKSLTEPDRGAFFMERVFASGFAQKVSPELQKQLLSPEPVMTMEETAAANQAFQGFDFRSLLPSIQTPTLIISGKYDGLNPPAYGQEISSLIPDSIFVEMENSGHAPSAEEPERFKELVLGFLKERLG